MVRQAQCQCGALHVEAEGEPDSVVICSCIECQRRSGSPFGEGAYYARDKLTLSGQPREYVRTADSGKTFHTFFCPACGASLYWHSERDPNRVGVAVGAFAFRVRRYEARLDYAARRHARLPPRPRQRTLALRPVLFATRRAA